MPISDLSPRLASFAVLPIAVAAFAATGCAASTFVRAAEQGNYEGLRASLSADVEQGRIGIGEAARFARAVASGEVERAKGQEGAQRIRALLSCAREVDDALDRRADTRDALGAVAALVRLDAGIASAGRFSRWARVPVDAPEAAWRALGARSLTSGDDGDLRRAMFADPDEDVRRSALRAALEAADPADVEGVLESARVDPSPAARAALSAKLLKLADGHGPGSLAAKGALARAHDPRLLPILQRDGAAKSDKTRAEAGTALAVYGDLARAAVVAADPEPRVRVTVACAILRAWAAK